jgi:hypothetical protein
MADVKYEKIQVKGEEGAVSGLVVEALFNPKELGIDKTVPWKQQDKAEGDAPPQEFTTGQPRTLSFDLMADMFEDEGDVYADFVSKLEKFVMIDKGLKRPPMVTCAWSKSFPPGKTTPAFKGVVASMNVKYTMFLADGTPCRCNVTLKITEAEAAVYKGKDSKKKKKNKAPPAGTQSQQGQRADQAASAAGSDDHRTSMSNSGVDNPNDIPPGTTITA